MQRDVAGQHHRRDHARPGGRTAATPLRGAPGVPGRRRRDDVEEDGRGGRGARVALHPRRAAASHQGSARRRAERHRPVRHRRGRASAPRPDGASGQGGHGRRPTGQGGCEGATEAPSLCGVPQSGPGAQGCGHTRATPSSARGEARKRRPQERRRQQGLQALPQGREGRLRSRPRQGPRRGTIRRHVGIAHQHRAERRRGGITLQTTVDGRAGLPHCEESARYPPPSSTRPTPPSAGMSSARSSRWCCATSSCVAWTTLA